MSVEITISLGSDFFNSSRLFNIELVNAFVSVSGCLVIVRRTAGSAFLDASPNLGDLAPIVTVAMSAKSMVPFSLLLITVLAMSSSLVVLISPLIIYSLPYS